MATPRPTRKSTRRRSTRRSAVARVAGQRPLIMAAVGLALGAVVGSFLRLTPREKELLREGGGELKEQADRFRNGVSEVAVEGYFQAKQTIEAAANDLQNGDKPELPGSVLHNSLVMPDSKL